MRNAQSQARQSSTGERGELHCATVANAVDGLHSCNTQQAKCCSIEHKCERAITATHHAEGSPSSLHHNKENPRENTGGKFPRIIPVGTHGDDPAVKGRKSEILDTLRSHCEDKAFAHLLLDGIVVDNTTAGKQCEDPGFAYVRRKVHKFTTNDLAIPTPIAWVLFRKVLQKVAKGSPIVSYERAVAVGEACGIAADVVPSVLHFYHELAVFLHYTQIKSLSQCIIADPQWLVRQFGKLLAPKEFQQEISNRALWKPLQEKGILVQPLYEEVWQGSGLQPQALADLLEHFCLAALIDPRTKVSSFPGREYFVSSVLQVSSPTADNASKFVKKSSPLHLTFSTQYVPPGFFTRLATTSIKGVQMSSPLHIKVSSATKSFLPMEKLTKLMNLPFSSNHQACRLLHFVLNTASHTYQHLEVCAVIS